MVSRVIPRRTRRTVRILVTEATKRDASHGRDLPWPDALLMEHRSMAQAGHPDMETSGVDVADAPQEKTKTFRIYSAISGIVTLVAMIVAAVIIIISAVKHDTAMARCKVCHALACGDAAPMLRCGVGT